MEHAAHMREKRTHTGFWWRKIEGKIPPRKQINKQQDNITMGLTEVGWFWTGLI